MDRCWLFFMLEFSFVWLVSNIEKVFVIRRGYVWVRYDMDWCWFFFMLLFCFCLARVQYMIPPDTCLVGFAKRQYVVIIAAFRYLPGGLCEATHVKVKKWQHTCTKRCMHNTAIWAYIYRHARRMPHKGSLKSSTCALRGPKDWGKP